MVKMKERISHCRNLQDGTYKTPEYFSEGVRVMTNVVSSNPAHDEVYSIQHYGIKFVSDLRQVGGFLRFHPSIKFTATI
jgi:hypothetical protein